MNRDTDKDRLNKQPDANRDPITGTPGAHPVGTGVGAAGGGAAGAAIGMAAGPVGAVVGATVGAIAGGLAGKGAAEAVNPTVEDSYWRQNYVREPYVTKGESYDVYAPAYRTGYEGYGRYRGKKFEQVEADLQRDYEKAKTNTGVGWDRAKNATRAAWHRVERALPGDADRDGR